mmetsp:Transcript_128188/g.256002  ORF Transcript_128188/g.256002 Transcript_128188/m.256002 type:complete len:239 (+) Transcript_128188:57-773(+)
MRAESSADAAIKSNSGHRLAPSRFEEDAMPPGHASIWGSWYCMKTHRWGFRCCRATQRSAQPCRPLCDASIAFSATEVEPESQATEKAKDLEWKPRETFNTSEGFVAFALRRLSRLWMAWLRDGTLAAHARKRDLGSSTASVVLSEKTAQQAACGIEEFCSRLYQQLLAPELVSKLQEMCILIQAREYAQANKVYVDMAVGTRKWLTDLPVFVRFDAKRQDTDVSWTPDSGKHRRESS